MLAYNDIKPGVAVLVDGEPYVCTWNNIMKKQQRRPVNQTKLRHIIKGNSIEYSFQQSDKLEEAEIETRPAVFIYERNGEWFFHDAKDKSTRFSVTEEFVGESGRLLKVKEAPPNTRGNTAQGGTKVVTLETGAPLDVPMFINEDDTIRVNTETGEYAERV